MEKIERALGLTRTLLRVARDGGSVDDAIFELETTIQALREDVQALREKNLALGESKLELEQRLKELEDFGAFAGTVKRVVLTNGTVTYQEKRKSAGQPPVNFCAQCFTDHAQGYLQPADSEPGNDLYRCSRCKGTVLIPNEKRRRRPKTLNPGIKL